MAGMPPFTFAPSAGGGGPSGASSNAGVQSTSTNPFNFDNSGWIIQSRSPGSNPTATGNRDANRSTIDMTGKGSLLQDMLGGGNMLPLILAAVGVVLILRR